MSVLKSEKQYNPFSLEGKTILVTGASSGIGKAISIEGAKLGAHLIINGRNEERLKSVFMSLEGDSHIHISGDLTKGACRKSISESIVKLDGIVNCAGIMHMSPLRYVTDDLIEELLATNFIAPVQLIRDLMTLKKINKNSSIVNITSVNGGVVGTKAHALYASTKAALTGFSRSLAIDFGKLGIRVNCIAPGMVETEGIERIYSTVSEQSVNEDKLKYPLRTYGTPKDIALGAVYLLSDSSKWVTGITLTIDGGFTAQ